jgi:predicted ester cyclase
VTVTGLTISRFSGGKIVEDWASYDQVGMFRQLGVQAIPAAAHAPA